ncbi:MAG: hypothetical protein D3M94_14385 [Rhodocyclales bacterium GT-UBC]|nr:MAG: hypothetical protein D3M94_14385 [Rhodocyclales bacterium GT-UBC]
MTMEDIDLAPSPELPPRPIKGRGAMNNVPHRFSREIRQAVDDGWTAEMAPHPATRLHIDEAKSILSRNDSPDLSFEQSLNPYRGCEHGCIYIRLTEKHYM